MRTRVGFILLALALIVPTSAGAASSGTFKVTVSGKQSLSWSLDGTHGNCEIRRGTGSGQVDLSFKSDKAASLFVSKSGGIVGSIPTRAKGTRSGNYGETTQTPCPWLEPSSPFTAEAGSCGAFNSSIRVDFKTKGAFSWTTGSAQPLPSGACPAFGDYLLSTDLTQCGDSNTQYKRSSGLAYGGIGLYSAKLAISMKSLLKLRKGKKETITARTSVDCRPASTLSSPITLNGELKYSLVFKRVS